MDAKLLSNEARYIYCVARESEEIQLGGIGIEEKNVYTIPCRDVSAVVHSCMSVPYDTKDDRLAGDWVLEHSYVIDQAMKRFGTVLPFSFDVIIRGDDGVIRNWLKENYNRLHDELARFHDEAEYSVQIFYDYDKFISIILSRKHDLLAAKEEIDRQSKGKAYLLRRNLDLKLKDAVSSEASRLAEQFGQEIRSISDEVKIENRGSSVPERFKDKKLMVSFSCLVHKDKVDLLGSSLERINSLDGLAVRFTGPWAPFSFVDMGAV